MPDSDIIHHKRCIRYNLPNHPHELTFSCYKRQKLLTSERACLYLAEAINNARNIYDFHVWAYVFMPEHVHLLIFPNHEAYSISNILRSFKQSVSRKMLIYIRKSEPDALSFLATGQKHSPYRFWQDGGGFDRNVTDVSVLTKMVDYIHFNPVRRHLVQSPIDWKWSSARFWITGEEGFIPINKESFYP